MQIRLTNSKKTIALAVATLGAVAPTSLRAQHFPADDAILEIIQARVEEDRATGIVVGVLEADGSRRIVAYGDPGPEARPLGPESVFEIGSISKVFTAILLADMAAKGEVSLEGPLQAYVHDGVTVPTRAGRQITLLDVATHRSSLPRLPNNMTASDPLNPYADYAVDDLHEFISAVELTRDIGAEYEYSNLAVGLLGHVLAARADTDYETLLRDRILGPLEMSMSGIALSPDMEAWLATGHDQQGNVTKNWDLPTLAGAGAIRSNMNDMLTFLAANVGDPGTDIERAMRVSHETRRDAGGNNEIGLLWHELDAGGAKIVWHNGGTGGYRTFIGFDPELGVGAVVLTNSAHGADDIGFHLVNSSVPLAPAPTPAVERHEIEVGAETLERYVGVYEIVPEFQMTITLEDGALHVQATSQPKFRLFPESETEFFLKVVDAQVTFVSEGDEVTSLILHQGGANQTARKVS